ncbi:hypothetical protein [Streptomyces sp. NPDC005251]|uniref:hypothetical protein n=1 Tax=unclassified Streptomyces TaxID=2593676 RepID=UPI0033BD6A1D
MTVAFRLISVIISDSKSWPTCAGMAAAAIATGELSERWHQHRRNRKSRVVSDTESEADRTMTASD